MHKHGLPTAVLACFCSRCWPGRGVTYATKGNQPLGTLAAPMLRSDGLYIGGAATIQFDGGVSSRAARCQCASPAESLAQSKLAPCFEMIRTN